MLFAALCGSQMWNSVIPLAPPNSAAASATAVELFGCALASSSGGVKSVCVSLLELSPNSGPNSSACTRSDRGGMKLGVEEVDSCDAGFFGVLFSEVSPCCADAATVSAKTANPNDRRTILCILTCVSLCGRQKSRLLRGRFEQPGWQSPPGRGKNHFVLIRFTSTTGCSAPSWDLSSAGLYHRPYWSSIGRPLCGCPHDLVSSYSFQLACLCP